MAGADVDAFTAPAIAVSGPSRAGEGLLTKRRPIPRQR